MVQRLREEFVKASRDPELQRRLAENGTLIATSTSEEMRAMMVDEVATMETLVKTFRHSLAIGRRSLSRLPPRAAGR